MQNGISIRVREKEKLYSEWGWKTILQVKQGASARDVYSHRIYFMSYYWHFYSACEAFVNAIFLEISSWKSRIFLFLFSRQNSASQATYCCRVGWVLVTLGPSHLPSLCSRLPAALVDIRNKKKTTTRNQNTLKHSLKAVVKHLCNNVLSQNKILK